MNGKIFLTYHDQFEMIKNELLEPIQVGESLKRLDLGILKDNEGINISHKNYKYSEFSVVYYMWKNLDLDYYGLFHYRRLFLFLEEHEYDLDTIGRHQIMALNDQYEKYGLTSENVEKYLQEYDVLIPQLTEFSVSLFTQYHYSISHHSEHLIKAFEIVGEKYPEYAPHLAEVLNGKMGVFTNLFVMKKDVFHDYCEWMFSILEEVDDYFQFEGEDWYERRYLGYLAERLNSLYFIYHLANNTFKVKEMNQLFLTDTMKKVEKIKESAENKEIYLYGHGTYAREILLFLEQQNIKIDGIISSNPTKEQVDFENHYRVHSPTVLENGECFVIIASTIRKKITKDLINRGICKTNIVEITIERKEPALFKIEFIEDK